MLAKLYNQLQEYHTDAILQAAMSGMSTIVLIAVMIPFNPLPTQLYHRRRVSPQTH